MQGDVLKARDLKSLTNEQLPVLAARMTLRVSPWRPVGSDEAWERAMHDLLRACGGTDLSAKTVRDHGRRLLDQGALGSHLGVPEAMWRSRSQAAACLASALEATRLRARKDRWKRVVQVGKHAASVFAVQAHAGVFPLAEALSVPWAAARADVGRIGVAPFPETLSDLEELGPLWPDGEPSWSRP